MSNKKTSRLYYLASICFYIVFLIKLFDSGFSSAVVWLCLGSSFFCLAETYKSKDKDNKSDDKNDKK